MDFLNKNDHALSVCGPFKDELKMNYVEHTASINRDFTSKKQPENTVKIVHRIVDNLVVSTLDTCVSKKK